MKPIIFFLTAVLFFCVSPPVSAQMVINEVFPAPSTGSEWVELYNSSSEVATVSGWFLEDQLSSPTTIVQLASGSTLLSHQFLVVEVGNKLNNSGDGVVLKNASGAVIDQMSYASSQSDQSWSRQPNGTGNFVLTSPTKGALNPSPSPSPTPQPTPEPTPAPSPAPSPLPLNLQLSEVMACPVEGENEWVELYNPDITTATLTNWKVRDSAGNTRLISGTVTPTSHTAFHLSSGILNNDGDTVILETPSGQQLFAIYLSGCQKGQSFISVDGHWKATLSITKGATNLYTAVTEEVIEENGEEVILIETEPTDSLEVFPTEVPPTHPPHIDPRLQELYQNAYAYLLDASASAQTASLSAYIPLAIQQFSPDVPDADSFHTQIKLPFLSALMSSVITFLCGYGGLAQWYTETHVQFNTASTETA